MTRFLLASLLMVGVAHAQPGPQVGPQPGSGYGLNSDGSGVLLTHIYRMDPTQGTMNYASVVVGTTSTQVLAAPTTLPRAKLYLLNASGRLSGTTSTDVYCAYGVPAAVGQGFLLAGYGDRVTEDMPAGLDQRPLNCISSGAAVTISVGAVQQ